MRAGQAAHRVGARLRRATARELPGEALVASALRQVTALGYVRLEDRRWPDVVPLGTGTVIVGPAGIFLVDVVRPARQPRGAAESVFEQAGVRRRQARALRAAAAVAEVLHPVLARNVHTVVALVGVGSLPVRSISPGVLSGDVPSLVAWLAGEPPRLAPHLADLVVESLRRSLPPAPPIATPSAREVSGLVNGSRPFALLLSRFRRG